MEKKWFCRYGLYALAALAPLQVLHADVREVEVEVSVSIEGDNAAAATEKAQAEAFKEAVRQTMPSGLGEEEINQRVRNAANFIKSFRLVEQREEAGKLYAKFKCEVLSSNSMADSSSYDGYEERFAFEFVWRSPRQKMALVELRKLLSEEYKVEVDLIHLQNASWLVELRSTRSPESLYANLSARMRPLAEVRLVKDLEGIFSRPEPSRGHVEPW